ncbi:hypothetical protein VV01_03315 [Luteipulveratus halotolerans]|uniref:Major facilitator superfamily (MFS) profile domain-containing protein n=1 Tax=Luteipulveratus halotolerans TaxID=1631356 RepID=A0A0L6CN38_9MICO|nr:hypothetical protein VV01_03315 [Luteipulveratus halotolerans]
MIGVRPPPVRRDPVVRVWLVGAAVSWFGDAVFAIALVWTAVHLVSPAAAGLVVAVEMVPQALLMLVGGVLADRVDTRRVLVIGHSARVAVLVAGSACWMLLGPTPGVLVGVALCFGAIAGLTLPATATLSRQLVPLDDIATVAGWSQVSGRLARLAGAPVGALVVVHGGMLAAMLLNAVSFAVISVLLLTVVRPRYALPRAPRERWRASLGEGVAYLRRTPTARSLVVGICALNIFIGPVLGLGVALRVSHAGWSAGWVGAAEVVFGVGAILGSIGGIRWQGTHLARRGFGALVVQGGAIAAVGAPSRPLFVVGALGIGVTAGLASVWISGAFQRTVATSYLGRVSSLNQLGDLALIPVTTPLLGALVTATSVAAAVGAFGVAMSVLCLWFATRPTIRALA